MGEIEKRKIKTAGIRKKSCRVVLISNVCDR